jgi:uncharacterized membrane protein YgdD (TMEM256/DUF423 family)
LAGVNGFIAVAAGAFGAHAGRQALAPAALELLETAVRYHALHALALLALGALAGQRQSRSLSAAGAAFAVGMLLFCGSLYVVALGWRPAALVAPFGGLALLAGWAFLVVAACRD